MKKVCMILVIIGLANYSVGLGTALGAPIVLQSIKLGNGTATGSGVSVSPDGNTYTVSGTGTDIWSAGDSFQFAYMQISGDFDIRTRLDSLTGNAGDGNWTKAGLMCRANITDIPAGAVAPFVNMVATTGISSTPNGLSWQCRKSDTVTDVASYSGVTYHLPLYLRLTRTANVFSGYYSQDGLNWTKMDGNTAIAADQEIVMTDPVYVGLAVTSHNAAGLSTGVFTFNYWGAADPTPADGAADVDYGDSIPLMWDVLAHPDKTIKDWNVFWGTEPNDLTATSLGIVNEPTRELASPVLASDTTYYWRVDGSLVDDPNVAKGYYWSFTTKTSKPVISPPLASVLLPLNCIGSFTAIAQSGAYSDQGDMTFVWKNLDGAILKTESGVLTSTYQTSVANTYYVEVSNINGTTKSNEVTLSIDEFGMPPFAFTDIKNTAGYAAGTSMTISGSTVTVTGSGNDIWSTADGFGFAHIPFSGDGSITARVASVTGNANDGNWTKVGVMFRESLASNSAFVSEYVLRTESTSGNTFQYRPSTGVDGISTGSGDQNPPYWVRLDRSGNTFTGYRSPDGITWTQHGTATVNMATDILVGLAVTAHSATSLSTGVFDNISITPPIRNWLATNPQYSANAVTTEGWINPYEDLTVSWTKALVAPCGSSYKVYRGLDPQDMTLLGQTDADVTQFVIPKNTLSFNKIYYWRVDTVYGPDAVTGHLWSFDTVKQYPQITTQPALITVVDAGGSANLNIVATTATVPELVPMVKYEWFFAKDNSKVGEGTPIDDGAGNFSCPVTLTGFQFANEGEYYCVVTNTAGPTTSAKGRVLTHRMVLHYTFEEVVNNIIADQSGSGIDGTLICPVAGGIPKYSLVDEGLGLGKAIRLVGPNDPNGAYITTNKKPMELGINGNLPKSVSVWAKAQAFNNGGLFDMGAYVVGQNFCLRTLAGYNNRWRVQFYSMDRDTNVDPSFDEWVHFVLAFDGVNTQLYVNGQLARDVNGNLINYYTELDTQNGNNVVLGRYNSDVNLYIGLIDDFRLYNYALSAEDAAQLYVAVKGGTICVPFPYDLDGDCEVNLLDFANFAAQWAQTGIVNP